MQSSAGVSSRRLGVPRVGSDRRKRRLPARLVDRLLLVLIAVQVPLFALELVLRIAGPVLPGDYQTTTFTAWSEEFGRQNLPNSQGWRRSSEYTTYVRVNSKGLRGPEIEHAKPPGEFRVLALGDSYTFALQVREEQTFVVLLQDSLQVPNAGVRFQTINAGADGWSTIHQYAWFGEEGFRYQPDVVVLMFFVGNDPGENADIVRSPAQLDRLLGLAGPGPSSPLRRALAESSAVWSLLEYGVLAKLDQPESPADLRRRSRAARAADVDRRERGWEVSQALFERLRDRVAEHGARLLVVGIPTVELLSAADRPPTPLRDIAGEVAVPALDLLDPFRSVPADLRERLYFEKNRHWTPDGHDLAARVVAAELRRLGLVPGTVE